MKKSLVLMGIGAGLMYFLDPEKGEARRAQLRDSFEGLLPQTKEALSSKADAVVAKAGEFTDKVDNAAAETIQSLGGDAMSTPEHSS